MACRLVVLAICAGGLAGVLLSPAAARAQVTRMRGRAWEANRRFLS